MSPSQSPRDLPRDQIQHASHSQMINQQEELYLRMQSGQEPQLQQDIDDLLQTFTRGTDDQVAGSALDQASPASFAENITFTEEKKENKAQVSKEDS